MSHRQHARSNRTRRLAQKWAGYAGMAALVAPTESGASIMHTSLGEQGESFGLGATFALDIDANGVADLNIVQFGFTSRCSSSTSSTSCGRFYQSVRASALGTTNRILGSPGFPQALQAGELIAHTAQGLEAGLLASAFCGAIGCGQDGAFLNAGRAFVGLLFSGFDNATHTGWIEVDVAPRSFSVFGYAYESEPEKPILAGDTGASPQVPGDTNGDGKVDITDLNNVRNNFGGTGLGDTNDNGTVDIEDLNAVRNNFGAAYPVPEPPSLLLLAAGAAGLLALRAKRNRFANTKP